MKSSVMKKQILLWLGAVLCVFIVAGYSGAQEENTEAEGANPEWMYAKINRNFNNPKQTKIVARVMKVEPYKAYMVIAENDYYVAKFKMNGERYMTELIDAAGNAIRMGDFAEGDRVAVTAIELDPKQATFVALKIEILPPR